ncbi:DUF4304 domain-containing protein [Paenibacillus kobensis]|uniref:DUF4304 domain-containing protein n=1 Tax=Paenibacillus kobensis TaxID=59841 RepID=UPI000FDBFDB2|nr:DUF4304 domain-containing protein [Paenibacillus kobensis]
MIDTKKFKQLLKTTWEPLLRQHGFTGSNGNYRTKVNDHFIYVVNIQGDRYGGLCCVNLGVYIDFIPNTLGKHLPLNKVSVVDCEFRTRLSDVELEDAWWSYGDTETEAMESIEHMTETFVQHGLAYFAQFQEFPKPFIGMSFKNVEQRTDKVRKLGNSPTDVRLALVIARVQLYIGQTEQATAWSQWALDQIGTGFAGRALIGEFEQIIQKAQGHSGITLEP